MPTKLRFVTLVKLLQRLRHVGRLQKAMSVPRFGRQT